MSPFDNNDKKDPRGSRKGAYGDPKNPSRRDDAKDSNRSEQSPFMKDKRPRINKPYSDRPRQDNGGEERRSYNPNFNKDNRREGSGRQDNGTRSGRTYGSGGKDNFNRSGNDMPGYKNKPARSHDSGDEDRFNRSGGAGRSDSQGRPYKKREWDDSRGGQGQRGTSQQGGYKKPWNKEGSRDASASGGYKKPWNKDGEKPFQDRNRSPKKRVDASNTYTEENYPRYNAPRATGAVRLNRFLANSGISSRREADDLIAAGVVTVNGQVVTEMGTKVNPSDEVRFNGEIVRGEPKVYIVMNKPKGFVTSLEDPHADKTVIDIVKNICKERVYPVGRLDKSSVGVLLITNDGELTKKLTHPSSNKKKIYQVSLDKPLTQADMQRLADGMELEDGPMFLDEVSYVKENKKEIGVEIHSGRNRVVRRMFEAIGYTVKKLDRVYFAGITKKGLKRGAWRFLTPREISMLKSSDYE